MDTKPVLPPMDSTLRLIFLDAFQFLQARQEPERNEAYWQDAATTMNEIALKWDNHPLATQLLLAVYTYLSDRAKEAT